MLSNYLHIHSRFTAERLATFHGINCRENKALVFTKIYIYIFFFFFEGSHLNLLSRTHSLHHHRMKMKLLELNSLLWALFLLSTTVGKADCAELFAIYAYSNSL